MTKWTVNLNGVQNYNFRVSRAGYKLFGRCSCCYFFQTNMKTPSQIPFTPMPIHNSPSIVPLLNQLNPVYAFSCYLFKIHLNIILPFPIGLQSGLCLQIFPPNFCMHLSFLHKCHMTAEC